MKRLLYKIYKKFEYNRILATIVHFSYGYIKPVLTGNYLPAKYERKKQDIHINTTRKKEPKKHLKDLKVAVISDEMTYQNLTEVCQTEFLTPDNWFNTMEDENPDVFFCEATWSGIEKYKDSWRGKIYKNKRLLFDNRGVLLDILDYCKKKDIPTVFWNKEDPVYFYDICHNFCETGLLFDYLFTTSEELIDEYKKRGHSNVYVMGFGFSPAIYDCCEDTEKENKAVFAGSWYSDLPERCKDMEAVFDMLIEKKIPLEIYDRYSESSSPQHRFPEKYQPFIHKSVPYKKLGEIYSRSRFAININTEKNSNTMYARRIHELMACKCIVVSNESKALKKIFEDKIWFVGSNFDLKNEKHICESNYDYVMKHFTNEILFTEMFSRTHLI